LPRASIAARSASSCGQRIPAISFTLCGISSRMPASRCRSSAIRA
jgi:hypothetical protein